jgi:hypothetical protein
VPDNLLPMSPARTVPRVEECALISRRNFLGFLAPLPLLPIVGPHMMLSDKPTRLGWTPALPNQSPFDVEGWINAHGGGFKWKTVAERFLLQRDLEREILRRQRLSAPSVGGT